MSEYIRANKRKIAVSRTQDKAQQQQPDKPAIQATIRSPLSHAAVGIASMMLASTSATAQDASTPPKPTTSTVGQQDASQLPKIRVRATKRAARQRPVPTTAPATPTSATAAADAADRSYQGSGVSGLTRVPTPLINTPQTVNVVPQQVIREQNASTSRMLCATSRASHSAPAKAATRATRHTSAASLRRTTFSATGCAIRAGIRATPSRSTRSKSTRARRRCCSDAARPAAPST